MLTLSLRKCERHQIVHHFQKVEVKANFPREDVYGLFTSTDDTSGIYLMKPSTLGLSLLSY